VYENRLNAKETLLAGFGKHCLRWGEAGKE
jgi:hypothetical protein